MKRSLLLAPLLVLALTGFGCKKAEPAQAPVPNAAAPVNSANPAVPEAAAGVSRDVLYARQVLRNLSQAKSFHASLIVPSASGRINTTLDFNRLTGMLGRIDVTATDGATQTAQLFASEAEIWFRQGTSTWVDLTKTDDGKRFQAVFANAFSYSDQYQSTVSDTAALVAKTEDRAAGCQRQAFTQKLNDGSTQAFTLCVKQDLPVYLTIDGPFGQIEVHYKDINGSVEVKRPV